LKSGFDGCQVRFFLLYNNNARGINQLFDRKNIVIISLSINLLNKIENATMVKDILLGLTGYFKHLPLISKLGLWRYIFIPMLIGILLMVAISTSAYGLSDNLGNWLTAWYPWSVGSGIINTFGTLISGIVIFIAGIIGAKYLVMILASPFMSPMSEKIEQAHPRGIALTSNPPSTAGGIIRGLRIAARNIFKELLVTAGLLLIGIIIPFLSPITAVLIFLLQAYYAGGGNMDFTLERYYGVKESRKFVRANRGLAIGNGIVFIAMLMLGFGFLFAPSLGTLAVTTEVVDRIEADSSYIS